MKHIGKQIQFESYMYVLSNNKVLYLGKKKSSTFHIVQNYTNLILLLTIKEEHPGKIHFLTRAYPPTKFCPWKFQKFNLVFLLSLITLWLKIVSENSV